MGAIFILPGTGRGTMRSMVEGGLHLAQRGSRDPLHRTTCGPPPRERGGQA
jgi:hypothetical protein